MTKRGIPYSDRELFAAGPQPWLRGRRLRNVAFPLGGLGTGCVSLGGWGQLRDWEIRNAPAKGFTPPFTFFTLRTRVGKKAPVVRVLQGPAQVDRVGDGHSARRYSGEGLPHFADVAFRGEFPIAQVRLRDKGVPLDVAIEAYNPFIPLNARDSGLPAAVLLYHFTNPGKQRVHATIFGNHTNITQPVEGQVNECRSAAGLTGLVAENAQTAPEAPEFGATVLASPALDTAVWTRWSQPNSVQLATFWRLLHETDAFPPAEAGTSPTGTVAVPFVVEPGETVTIPFFLCWHFPTVTPPDRGSCETCGTFRNWYATQWGDAWDVARYLHDNFERLDELTRRFRDTLFASTLPTHVLDAVSSQISTLKTTVVLRLEDGSLYGFEGASDDRGCCPGSCTHVWNYAQALPFLFPDLQRSLRENHYRYAMADDGFIQFRIPLPLGRKPDFAFHPAADGQMGGVVQVYRDWRISGDTDWLREMWPLTRKALEFAWKYWDADRDGVMEGMQHNTYDIEFYGPNSMCGSLYLAALRAAEEMARALGETAAAEEYRRLFEKGSAWADANLFNGSYYEQKVDPDAHKAWPERQRKLAEGHGKDLSVPDWPAWQFGKGCLSDQLIGEWLAALHGLGHLYKPKHVRKTLASIFKHNWRREMGDVAQLYRLYALQEEAGLLVATWPRGERPGSAFYFADEVWTGHEYEVASHLILEGMVKEGLSVVLGARRRYDGESRNPWDEIECGHHYVRAMSSYALLLALSGFRYSAPDQTLRFDPRVSEGRFRCFFSVGSGWGLLGRKTKGRKRELFIEPRYGEITLSRLETGSGGQAGKVAVTVDKTPVKAEAKSEDGLVVVEFGAPVRVREGQRLRVRLG